MKNWRCHDVQFESIKNLLGEVEGDYIHQVFESANIRAPGVYIYKSTDVLAESTKEIAIDGA